MRLSSEDSPGYEHQKISSYHGCSLCAESLDIDVKGTLSQHQEGRCRVIGDDTVYLRWAWAT